MSREAAWELERMPTEPVLDRHVDDLVRQARIAPPRVQRDVDGEVALVFEVAASDAIDVVERLGVSSRTRDAVRRDLASPRDADRPARYALGVIIVPPRDVDDDGDPGWPRVAVHAGTCNNREAWPIVHDLGLALAERLGMRDQDITLV